MKQKGRLNLQNADRTLSESYKTPFWNEIHSVTKRIYEDECTQAEAIRILLRICERLIGGVKKNLCAFEDLHYAMETLSHIDFMYETGAIYDLYDGELYGLVEYIDGHDNIDEIEGEYKSFRKKHPQL